MTGTVEIEMEDGPTPDVQSSAPPQSGEQPPRPAPPSRRPEESTLYFAAEIERSFVSTLWHHPEFLDLARHELDFELHITVRAYQKILRAVEIVHGDIGIDLDWTCVAQCLLDLKALDECGGVLGLDEVYTDRGHYPEGRAHPEPALHEHIRLLREYAIARQTDPFATVRRYTGYGLLTKNKFVSKPSDPTVIGRLRCPDCGHDLRLRGWPNGAELKLKAEPERK